MGSWSFGDVRLSARADQLLDNIVATGSLVLRRVGETRAGELAAHRFLDNERVSPQAIIDTLSARTLEACRGRRILVVQDTTEVNFAGRDASRRGLGHAGGDKSVGFFIHPLIAIDIESSAVLGIVDAEIWTRRQEATPARKKRPFQEKDSARWLRGCRSAVQRLPACRELVVAADRESDIYTVLAQCPPETGLIVRASHDRRLQGGERLFDGVGYQKKGTLSVEIGPRPGQKARIAKVALRAGQARLPRPQENVETDDPLDLEVNIVEALEIDPPKGSKPVEWRLVTTLPVTRREDVRRVIELYRLRWRIEEVFRVLKTDGLDLEATQVEAADRLFKLAALGLVAATRIIQLVDARDGGDRPAEDVIAPRLIDPVAAIGAPLEGKTDRQKNPHPPGTLSWLAWIVARLGGWNCYYKPPGPKTMAIGWKQIAARLEGYILAVPQTHPTANV